MSGSSYRLTATDGQDFAGRCIDRNKRLSFRLEGRTLTAQDGDTILSALLAAGIDGAGSHAGHELGLAELPELPVRYADGSRHAHSALPIGRTRVTDGAEYTLFPRPAEPPLKGWLKRVTGRRGSSLGVDFTGGQPGPAFFADMTPEPHEAADVVVVGGGIAGLSAARRAAEQGKSVLLVEERMCLGGDAELFGHAAGEEAPGKTVARLADDLSRDANVTLWMGARALSFRNGVLMVHRIAEREGRSAPGLIALSPKRTVLATGASCRLPVFPGNRLPGVAGLATAFHLAVAYGVWPGPDALVATSTNSGYRLALMAQDAGTPPGRVIDSRLAPQSRFIEFCKAYGIRSAPGLQIQAVSEHPSGRNLTVLTELATEGGAGQFAPLTAGSAIVAGGWLPRLQLWLDAGGRIETGADGAIAAGDGPGGVALAGAAAGYVNNPAIVQSGSSAIGELFGRPARKITDTGVDAGFESADGPLPASSRSGGTDDAPAYLSQGSLLARAEQFGRQSTPPLPREDNAVPDAPLDLPALAGMVASGELEMGQFGDIARERAVSPLSFSRNAPPAPTPSDRVATLVPQWLSGRFGDDARIVELHGTGLEAGSLLYPNSDQRDPEQAVGVVVRPAGENSVALALLSASMAHAGLPVSVRSVRGTTEARIGAEASAEV